ncbi:TRAP transporter small permease [Arthrobacter sp. zg-Y895]|uniref:TRAP transporter small permease n=1 Tax=Arthrobacter sp. zg-Y895 TaxID=2886933 RepID=UPI001D145177|nr:TRAP transporter small permease [Arthrobacter sp. zg-Y895]MCC3300637.1 TRAP transporter small permease [Arthrobacter sp. zg-Y895]
MKAVASPFDRTLTSLENALIVATFASITLLAFANVVSRYALHASLSWSNELVVGLAVYLIMIGTSAAIRMNAHPAFTVLQDIARPIWRKIVVIAIAAAMFTFLAIFLWLGWDMVTSQFERGRATPALGLPQWLLSLALPLGAVLSMVRVVQMAVTVIQHDEQSSTQLLPGG